ncbi:MAG: hypothetical protein GTO14_14455 [Anaerolineales bacterium]|nr:hypothetical protein [Anaerolineales bacterium]
MKRSVERKMLIVVVVTVAFLGSCDVSPEVDVPLTLVPTPTAAVHVIEPTPEPPPPKTLIVCLNREPSSLYIYDDTFLYGDTGVEANTILQAIYDGPIDIIEYQPQPVILERLPNLPRGEDARLEEVSVREGEIYLNPLTLLPELLQLRKPFLASGCVGSDCIRTYEGGEVFMPRMVVDFRLLPDLLWSDGTPLTVEDSVYSFEIDRHSDTPTSKYLVDRTASYETAADQNVVRWTGIPGFLDSEYKTNFWTPLPKHLFDRYTPAELLSLEEASSFPLGWGPYVIESWTADEQIVMRRNAFYFRAAEGLPKFEVLIFRFVGGDGRASIQQLLTGECDVLDESVITDDALDTLLELEESGHLKIVSGPGAQILRMDFNLDPVGVTDNPGLFADARTRRAIAGCISRDRIADELFSGLGVVPNSIISPSHPDYFPELDFIPYDIDAANTLMEEIGWQDDDGLPETARVAINVPNVNIGTPLSFTYLTVPGSQQELLAEILRSELRTCGVDLTVEYENPAAFRMEWPEGTVFGRRFQTVGWSWPDWWIPVCEMFAGRGIPSVGNPFGSNASGFNDPEYNAACEVILLGAPEAQEYRDAVQIMQQILARELPAVPLLVPPRVVASAPEVCGVEVDPLAFSVLWDLESYDVGEGCQ